MLLTTALRVYMQKRNAVLPTSWDREVLTIIDRFLRHNGHEKAADDLHTEHMP